MLHPPVTERVLCSRGAGGYLKTDHKDNGTDQVRDKVKSNRNNRCRLRHEAEDDLNDKEYYGSIDTDPAGN